MPSNASAVQPEPWTIIRRIMHWLIIVPLATLPTLAGGLIADMLHWQFTGTCADITRWAIRSLFTNPKVPRP